MRLRVVDRDGTEREIKGVRRIEAAVKDGHGERLKMILLDADDTFDVIVEYPDGNREVVKEITKEGEYLGN